ncbi:unnamed protein product [Ixodes persulcatus]
MGTVDLDDVIRCSECATTADSPAAMSAHCQRMHGDVYTAIRCCDSSFFTRNLYHSHCLKVHPDRFICDQCKDTFKTRASLNAHRLTFVKTYTCPLCGVQAAKLPMMRRHIAKSHAVILDQGYILVGLQPTQKADEKRTRVFFRKLLKLLVPCCALQAARATASLLTSDEFERSYTCGLVSRDVFDLEFAESQEPPLLGRAGSPEEGVVPQDALEDPETAESASGFFDVGAEEIGPTATDELKVRNLLNFALTKTVAAVGIF